MRIKKSRFFQLITFATIIAITLSMLIIGGCTKPIDNDGTSTRNTNTANSGSNLEIKGTQEIKKFDSADEVMAFLKASNEVQGSNYGYFGGARGGMMMKSAMAESMNAVAVMDGDVVSSEDNSVSSPGTDYSTDFSQTNIQVENVDEADFVKNDGKYIYTIVQDKLVIVNAYPAENAELVSETKVAGYPSQMFVNGDRLAIFTQDNEETQYLPEFSHIPYPRYESVMKVIIYDITDRTNPEIVREYVLKGNYVESRMIGDYVYFVGQDGVNYYGYDELILPVITLKDGDEVKNGADSADIVKIRPDVYYFDNYESYYNFNTVASFNIKDAGNSDNAEDELNAKTFMMGGASTIYVSKDNMYIAYQKTQPWRYYQYNEHDRFFNVVVPMLPSDIQDEIKSVEDENSLSASAKWNKQSAALEKMYNRMTENEKDKLLRNIEEALNEYDTQAEIERAKTIIHKIAINDGDIEYATRGEVPGYLLNQFSLDENDNNLRVATTTQLWVRNTGSILYNNVFVLNSELEKIGELTNIAKDETIHSTRFIGDRLYMVTFKRIDPFFVIDLSNPEKPTVLGELKIPGYSDYLHPYDENHIIGFGKDTEDMGGDDNNGNGWTVTRGLKIALFDVTDVSTPKEVGKVIIGDRDTYSEVLNDHKALLFDKTKNILVLPIRETKGEPYRDQKYGYHNQRIWQGAYVYSLTPEDGFSLKGKISHQESDEQNYYWYYGAPGAVRRALYMDNVLYTISQKKIMMNSIDNIDNEIGEVELPYKDDSYRNDYPMPYIIE